MSKLWSIALTLLVATSSLLTSGPQAAAGWGHHWHHGWGYYPGWSAWSYPAWGFSRVTTYSVGPGWGYYRGFGCWPRHRYYSYYAPRVINYSVALPSVYYAPATYYYPTYDVQFVAPIPVAPSVCLPTPLVKTTSAQSKVWQTALRTPVSPAPLARGISSRESFLVANNPANAGLVNTAIVNRTPHEPSAAGRLVTAQATALPASPIQPASTAPQLPAELLQRTDALFGRGQYAEAAAAYARLTVSYGNHNALAVRRFIALVASGDCHQAAVIFELASASGQTFAAQELPTGGLATLYGSLSDNRKQHIEVLAEHALKNADDGLALAMVGTWLQLDGQTERARPFMERAASLAPTSAPTAPPANDSSHLVATSFSR